MFFRRKRDEHIRDIKALLTAHVGTLLTTYAARLRELTRVYEERVLDLKAAHEQEVKQLMRLVDALAEQIEYLRAQAGRPHMGRVTPSGERVESPMENWTPWVSEEEEDIEALREFGHLSEQEVENLRRELGLDSLTVS